MEVEDVGIDLTSSIEEELCEASTSGNVPRSLEQFTISCEPRNGMEFESKEAAYYFYREYARSVGFGITIKASRRSKRTGKFIDVKIACSRFGTKRDSTTGLKPRSCPKTDCKAGLHMKRKEDDKWIVYSFVKEHNHEISPDDFNISVKGKNNKPACSVSNQKKCLVEDLRLLLEHFTDMQDKQPGFFYAVDFDCERRRVRNVFWIDAKAKHDYISFSSDVVLFDTFYVRNGYRVLFAPFVGVGQHRQYLLLGCALIGEESESTYSWLFRTWLKAVGDQAPGVIVTDQDKVLTDVVGEVLPSARHCFCLWNVLSKIPETLSQEEGFMERFRNCVLRSWTDEEFEKRWSSMIVEFELSENEWAKSLFRDRKKWALCYFRGISLAGLSGHERSKSIASHFDKYMNSEEDTTFYELYMKFLQHRSDVEVKEDLKASLAYEKQLSLVYTDAALKRFQAEVQGVVSCQLHKEREDGIFRVEDFEERESFLVAFDKDSLDVCCSCRLFEYQGFLCKHAMLVLRNSGVSSVPSRYVLKRWSKSKSGNNNRGDDNEKCASAQNRMARFDDICRRFVKVGEVASVSDEAYKTALKLLEEATKQCICMNNSPKLRSEADKLVTVASKLSKRRKKRKEQVSSRALSLENGYNPQAGMGETDLGSRSATLGVYDSNSSQQTSQGVGYNL